MEGIWRTLAVPIIASVVGAVAGALIVARIHAPELPAITAHMQWVDAPNPFYSIDRKYLVDLDKLVQSIWGTSEWVYFIEGARFLRNMRLISLQIQNSSNIRSKQLEISSPDRVSWLSEASDGSYKPLSSKLRLKSLDPKESAKVIGIANVWSSYQSAPLLILHDGKKIEAQSRTPSEESMWLMTLFEEYPILSWLSLVAVALGAGFLVALPFLIAAATSPAFKAYLTTKEELAKTLKFIEYMKVHYPEKFSPTNQAAAR